MDGVTPEPVLYRCVTGFHHCHTAPDGTVVRRYVSPGDVVPAGAPELADRSVYWQRVRRSSTRRRDTRRLIGAAAVVTYVDYQTWGAGLNPDGTNTSTQGFIGTIGLLTTALLVGLLLLALVTVLVDRHRARRQSSEDVAASDRVVERLVRRASGEVTLPAVAADDDERQRFRDAAMADMARADWWFREGCWDTAAILGGVPTAMVEGMLRPVAAAAPEAVATPVPAPPAMSLPPVADGESVATQLRKGRDVMILGPSATYTPLAPSRLTQPCPSCGLPFTFAHEPIETATLMDGGAHRTITGPIAAPPSHLTLTSDQRWRCRRPDGRVRDTITVSGGTLITEPRSVPPTPEMARARVVDIRDHMEELVAIGDAPPPWAVRRFRELEAEFRRIEPTARRLPVAQQCDRPGACSPVLDPVTGDLLGYVHTEGAQRIQLFNEHHRRTLGRRP